MRKLWWRPRHRCQNAKNWMESNGGETQMRMSDTSIASKRAKEHSNRSSGVEVMVKIVNQPWLVLGGAVVSLVWAVVPLLERPGGVGSGLVVLPLWWAVVPLLEHPRGGWLYRS